MSTERSNLADWTPEQLAQGQAWVRTWKHASGALEKVRRDELRRPEAQLGLALLCGSFDYHVPPRAPKPTSGLVEQQRWFKKAAHRD
jgi:hypothetical protein